MLEPGVGRRLGKYQILSEIGRGGMAVVYRAFDPSLQRYVALKVLSPRLASDEQVLRRFELEATTAANLKHPNIVVIYDVGSAEGYHFLVMELLEGCTLREEIGARGALSPGRTAYITSQLASALDYAHQHGLIHRDVKPSNVILGSNDHATLTDFGLVRATHSVRMTEAGAAVGTLEYMAPEQLGGDEIDWRSDVYSLGVVVYESLAGRAPFTGDTPYSLMQKVMSQPPPPVESFIHTLPPGVGRVVAQALAKLPSERFRSAGEFAAALYHALSGDELELVDQLGHAFRLRRGTMTVGRDADNLLAANDGQVSRHHAEIQFDGASWNLLDLQSTNGTFVNEQRIWPGQPRRLLPGDVVRFGPNIVFQVRAGTSRPTTGPDDTLLTGRPTSPHVPGKV